MFVGHPGLESEREECKPGYEETTRKIKKCIKDIQDFMDAIRKAHDNGVLRGLTYEELRLIYAIYGALSLRLRAKEIELEILERLEKKEN